MVMKFAPSKDEFIFQDPVISRVLTAPPATPSEGDRYIIGLSATGAWAGYDNYIAYYYGAAWRFVAPVQGMLTEDLTDSEYYKYTAGAWSLFEQNKGDLRSIIIPCNGENSPFFKTTKTAFQIAAMVPWAGTTLQGTPVSMRAVVWNPGGNAADWQVYDATNALVIASGSTSSTTPVISTDLSLANLPSGEVILEVQLKSVSGTAYIASVEVRF